MLLPILLTASTLTNLSIDQNPQTSPNLEQVKKIQQMVAPLVADGQIPGIQIVIATKNGGISAFKIGTITSPSPTSKSHPLMFEIGSISKTFTGLLLADMVVKNEVNLTDPVEKYLPSSVTMPSFENRKITLEDLATQTSGLPSLPLPFNPKDPDNPYADMTEAQIFGFLSHYKLTRVPGSKYEYSNLGMGLLGIALSKKAGTSYENLINQRILRWFGMTNTKVTMTTAEKKYLAVPHNADLERVSPWDIITLAGAGGIRSTESDMSLYLAATMLLSRSELSSAIELAQKPHRSIGNGANIGLAWHMTPKGDIWHNGMTGGFSSFLGMDSSRKVGVLALCNAATPFTDRIAVNCLAILKGETPVPITYAKPVVISPANLARLTGEYALSPTFKLTITMEAGKLFAQATGQDKFRVYPSSEKEFTYHVVPAKLIFQFASNGKVTGLTLVQNGNNMPAKKL